MEGKKLEIKHVSKEFPLANGVLEVLDDINLTIEPGEFVSIVGTSGCGKSTLIRMIAGLETPTQGEILVGGKKVERPSVDTGLIFQESRLYPWLSVEENIGFGIHKKLSKAERKKIIPEYIKLVGLEDFAKSLPRQLSGGMQQRVSIARTLINQPSVLLLDEPFGALDAFTRINMQKEILDIWKKEKTTMLLITHDIDEAIFLSDRIVILSNRPGKVSKVIKVSAAKPRDRSSMEFVRTRREIYSEFSEFFGDSSIDIEYYI